MNENEPDRAGDAPGLRRTVMSRYLMALLLLGGCFLYPSDRRRGYENGRLRTLYEACPIAFLIEQAGGAATDGLTPILDRVPASLHEHTPLVFGCRDEVATIARYLSE